MENVFHITERDETLYQQERDRVLSLLRETLPTAVLEEIGSTSVKGVIGKEDIDILAHVAPENFIGTRGKLDSLFQRHPTQISNESYQSYIIDSPLDIALQVTIPGGSYDDFLAFKNMLGENMHLVQAYNNLKHRYHGQPMETYRAAKDLFIDSILNKKPQILELVDDLFSDLLNEKKKDTIRFRRGERNIVPGWLMYIGCDNKDLKALVWITDVKEIPLCDVPLYSQDHFGEPADSILTRMKRHYPHITLDTNVLLVLHLTPQETEQRYGKI